MLDNCVPFRRVAHPTYHVYECAGCKARAEIPTRPAPFAVEDLQAMAPSLPRSPLHGWVAADVLVDACPTRGATSLVLCPVCAEKAIPGYREIVARAEPDPRLAGLGVIDDTAYGLGA